MSGGRGAPFDSLTALGQARRLRVLAGNALDAYGRGDAHVSLLKRSFNTLFEVVDGEGAKTALRVGARERIHTEATETVEAAWLAALRAETTITAPLAIASASGAYVTRASAVGVPEPRVCMLFEWARGRRLSETVSVGSMHAAGRLLAQLHEHGAHFEGGRAQPVLVGDHALGFLLPDRIPRDDPAHGSLYGDAIERAQVVIDGLWSRPPHPPHLLHGDLHANNILVWHGRLTPIDFQDLLWGFEIQDIAIAIMALEPFDDAPALADALRAGYCELRTWPVDDDAQLDALVAARHLTVLNLGFNLRRAGIDAFVARHTEWLRSWMRDRS